MDKTYVFNSDGGANGFANSVLPLLQQRGIDPAILLNGNNGGFGGGEFLNSTTHEIRHLVDDIAKTDAMPMCGEGVAYLTGDIINEIADIVCKFSCNCCRKKAHLHKKS